jgi:TolB-like protein/Flp pilus assembly protein TadD
VLALLSAVVIGWWLSAGGGDAPAAPDDDRIRIAVLVFDSRGAGEDDAFIGEGITEDINTQLSKVSGFEVKAHASARQLNRTTLDYGTISTTLGADYLVDGTVRAVSDSVRITVRLIDPETEGTRWAEDYTREFTVSNLFGVTRDVAEQVANDLRLALSAQEQERLAATPTEDTWAYRLYLEGRYFWNQRTAAALSRSVELFSQAVERDPQFALAHAGLADAYSMLRSYGGLPANQAMPMVRAAALRALEIDSTLAEAYTSLAYSGTFDREWSIAEQHFQTAMRLKPDYATAHQWHGWHLAFLGQLAAARDEFERAIELDPLSLIINTDYGAILSMLQEYDAAIAQLSRVLELDPDFVRGHNRLGQAYVGKGMLEQAIAHFRRGLELSGGAPRFLGRLGHANAVRGNRAEAERFLGMLMELGAQGHEVAFDIALVHTGLGDTDAALVWLERAIERGPVGARLWDHCFASLRSDARFQELVRRMNLPDQGGF